MSKLHIFESGVSSGTPVVFFHGFPGCHKQVQFLEPHAKSFNLRVLSPDRPGYAYSQATPGKGLKHFLDDLEEELDQRGIKQFYVLGVSGGNPAAVSAASRFGERVLALGSVCGLAPYSEVPKIFDLPQQRGLMIAKNTPEFMLRPLIERFIAGWDPNVRIGEFANRLNERDRALLNDPETKKAIIESIMLARRQGAAGIVFDLKSYTSKWPADYDKIVSPYLLWHGEQDKILPAKMSEYLSSKVKHSRLKLYPQEGHYSLAIQRAEELLTDLLSSSR